MKQFTLKAGLVCAATFLSSANATIVEFQTSHGSFQVNLFDQATPKTVENFLGYVERQDYKNSYFHRSVSDFIVQGGGVTFDEEPQPIETQPAIANEPVYSNVAGTIAMAKVGGNPDSATSQFFFNVSDNSANLDLQNGGFSVFGQVIGEGMDVVNAINALPTCSGIPLDNYSTDECEQGVNPTEVNLVMVNNVIVIDDTPNTAADLNPVENTLIDDQTTEPDPEGDSSSGSLAWLLSLFAAALVGRKRLI